MTGRPAGRGFSVVRALGRDVFVRLLAAVLLIEIALYVAPVTPGFRSAFGTYFYQLPFLALQLLAAIAGLTGLASTAERRFWRDVATAFACWLTGTTIAALTSSAVPGRSATVLVDLPYVASYVFLMLAIERRPHYGIAGPLVLDRRIRTIGLSAIGIGWYVYFVLIPASEGSPGGPSVAQADYCYVVLGLVLIVLGVRSVLACRDRRWTRIYAVFTAALVLNTITDALDLLLERGVLSWRNGRITDLLWAVPPGAFLLAARLRHVLPPRPAAAPVTTPSATDVVRPVATAGGLLAGAFSFPLIFIWTSGAPFRSSAATAGRSVLVLGELVLLTSLALVGYVALGRRQKQLGARRHEIEARLRHVQHMEAIGQVAGGVAHDFANLLTAAQGYTDTALRKLGGADQRRRLLEEIRVAVERAVKLTRQLLAFSRRQTLTKRTFDINDVVREAAEMLSRLIGEDVALDVRLAPHPLLVTADPSQIEAALLSLALNAREAMEEAGTLTITTAQVDAPPPAEGEVPKSDVELIVGDTGAGIAAAVLPHIFEPFFSTKARDKGTGLGLAAVYGIVTQSGGTIAVSSEPGHGSTFSIRLPQRADAVPESDLTGSP